MNSVEYWEESLSLAADECGLVMTDKQLKFLAEAMDGCHENYGMAFYTPPASDRYAELERQHKAEIEKREAEHERYKENAEEAVKKALRQYPDAQITIGEHGEVLRYGGRTEQIQ